MTATAATRPDARPTRFGPRDWVVDVAVAGAVAALSFSDTLVAATGVAGWGIALRTALVLAGALPLLGLVIRRRWPMAAFGIAAVGMAIAVALPDVTGPPAERYGMAVPPVLLPASIAFFGVLYSISAHARRPWPEIALAVSTLGGVAAVIRIWSPHLGNDAATSPVVLRLALLTAVGTGIAGSWGLGRWQAARHAADVAAGMRRQEQDRLRIEAAVVAERRRIARELHDVVSHSLAVMVRQAEGGRMIATKKPERAAQALDQVATTGRAAMADMRSLLGVLRESDETEAAVPAGSSDSVDDIVARLRTVGLPITSESHGEPVPLPADAHLAANRVVQEALTNVLRHAGAGAPVVVTRQWEPDRVQITVRNGPDPAPDAGAATRTGPGSGLGLSGLRERVELIGGSMRSGPASDGGYVVAVTIPTHARRS